MNNLTKTTRRRVAAALVVIALTGGGVGLWSHIRAAHGHGHDHAGHAHDHGHGAAVLALNDGKRWETDQPLRTGMQRIRDASSGVIAAERPLTKEEAKALATALQDAVGYLMQNCRLEPRADATLHVLITDLLSGAGLLAENPSSPEGAALILRALQRYPEYFDHPGWESSAGPKRN
jgi:hypothetical protein